MELDHEALQIDVWLGHKEGARWECPECERLCGLQGHAEERSWRHLDSCQAPGLQDERSTLGNVLLPKACWIRVLSGVSTRGRARDHGSPPWRRRPPR